MEVEQGLLPEHPQERRAPDGIVKGGDKGTVEEMLARKGERLKE